MNFKTMFSRLKNAGTIIGITSGAILILTSLGFKIDDVQVMLAVKTLCGVGIALGVLNNPDTTGLDLPGLPNNK